MMKPLTWSNPREELFILTMVLFLNLEALLISWDQAKEEGHPSYNIAILLHPKKQPTITL